MKTPILKTDRLILRPFRADDLEAVFHGWETDPDVARYMMWESHDDISKTKNFIKMELQRIDSDDWYRWAIVIKETNLLIGTCLIYYKHETDSFEVAYNLGKKHWGQGYTTEAMNEAIKFAKDFLGIKELLGGCAKVNAASEKVMKKLGFTYVKDCPYDCGEEMQLEGVIYRLQL
ncbi:GNAT family N-acetyltransferase [Vallitalea okinawensis]|uniref:GNAT family N-acetyltransferase n=1 Tax=Vallitalea okinawensis TaxID=2078660 RepID=UPI000CFBA206|nr:GNAT family N-acetyltransferase [Vallitalea okinawensis]